MELFLLCAERAASEKEHESGINGSNSLQVPKGGNAQVTVDVTNMGKRAGIDTVQSSIVSAGIAHSGVIDTEHGVVLSFPRPDQMAEWENVPWQAIFEKELKVRAVLKTVCAQWQRQRNALDLAKM